MSNTTHTPAPWTTSYNDAGHPCMIRGEHAVCVIRTNNHQEAIANAKLIEAAPLMLQEMLRYLPVLERIENDMPAIWYEMTQGTGIATLNGYREAIKKAGGKP